MISVVLARAVGRMRQDSAARHVQMDNGAGRERPELDEPTHTVGRAELHRAEDDALLLRGPHRKIEGHTESQELAPVPG
jgi:hypothetical protein